jgi:hypothetical protein
MGADGKAGIGMEKTRAIVYGTAEMMLAKFFKEEIDRHSKIFKLMPDVTAKAVVGLLTVRLQKRADELIDLATIKTLIEQNGDDERGFMDALQGISQADVVALSKEMGMEG